MKELWEPLFDERCPASRAEDITNEMLIPFLNRKVTKLQLRHFESISDQVHALTHSTRHLLDQPANAFFISSARTYFLTPFMFRCLQ